MPVDARAFVPLVTGTGATVNASRPKVNPLSVGLRAGQGPVTGETATHTALAYVALTPRIPDDLTEGARVTIDGAPYRILSNGITRGAGTWKLYLRAERAKVTA